MKSTCKIAKLIEAGSIRNMSITYQYKYYSNNKGTDVNYESEYKI